MKKYVTIILILFVSFSCFSQNSNKNTSYYLQGNKITQSELKSLDSRKFYTKEIKNDSVNRVDIYFHKKTGSLDSIKLKQIKMFLTKIIGSEFDINKKTTIHLYNKNNKQIYNDSKYKKYWNWIKKNSNQYQSFLIGTKDSQIKTDIKNHIYIDQYDLFKKLFFANSDFNINHLFIKPNGDIYIFNGLNDILYVLDSSIY